MEKINETLQAKKKKLKMFISIRNKLKNKAPLTNAEHELKGAPKTLEQAKAKIDKLKQQIEVDEVRAQNKEENKAVALGTSKINYMDPRITISWCKRKEVPIEKIFPTTLRKKFAWAMDNIPDWAF